MAELQQPNSPQDGNDDKCWGLFLPQIYLSQNFCDVITHSSSTKTTKEGGEKSVHIYCFAAKKEFL